MNNQGKTKKRDMRSSFSSLAKSLKKDNRGMETVELVILMPVFLQAVAIFLFAMQLIYAKDVALNSASLGCRSAILCTSMADAKKEADEQASNYANNVGMGVSFKNSVLDAGNSWKRGEIADYTVTINVDPILKIGVIGAVFETSQTSSMLIEKGSVIN